MMEHVEFNKRQILNPDGAMVDDEEDQKPLTVESFSLNDLPIFGDWLLNRLEEQKPWYSRSGWAQQIRAAMGMNEYFFRKCGTALFIGHVTKDPMDPRPYIREVLCWSMSDDKKVSYKECLMLLRAARDHAKTLMHTKGAQLGLSADMTGDAIKRELKGDFSSDVFLDMTQK